MTNTTTRTAATKASSLPKGFTLIELMVVVAILAIIAAMAYYNYGRYAYRARRADGKEMLTRIASAQERYYTNFNGYAPDLTTLGITATPVCGAIGASTKCYYSISTANGATGDNQSYVLTAAPVLGQAQQPTAAQIDACGSLTLNNQGVKSQSGNTTNGACW